jgi:hypothetical protein
MVARDGFFQYYTPFGIPASGVILNPRMELGRLKIKEELETHGLCRDSDAVPGN